MREKLLSFVALFVFIGLLPLLWFLPEKATALIWTFTIPLIPVFWLIFGYNFWRRICPLAWFAKLSQTSTLFRKRMLSPWIIKYFYALQFSLLLIAFSARHWLLNYDSLALLIFFIIVSSMAYLTGLFFSGKTWCNYLCPVGLVEKIYAGSNAKGSRINSACSTCTACKSNCPDIDLESSYWKEQHSSYKKSFFYAFTGLVFGFYFYYFLQTGSWESYFSGQWTHTEGFIATVMSDGFYFLPQIPQFLAVLITLVFFSVLSFYFFNMIEKFLFKTRTGYSAEAKNVQHYVMALSGFISFNIFYLFAGAPTFRLAPELYQLFLFAVVSLSVWWLAKELPREERFYPQERFARKVLNGWKGKSPKTKNLIEIYYLYINEQKDHKKNLETYTETVIELISNGILTLEELSLLDKIRGQLSITEHEHERIMRKLKYTQDDLLLGEESISQEQLFQRRNYQEALRRIVSSNQKLDKAQVEGLRKQFNISPEDHKKIIDHLLDNDLTVWENIDRKNSELKQLATIWSSSDLDADKESSYLGLILQESIDEALDDLQLLLHALHEEHAADTFVKLLRQDSVVDKEAFIHCVEQFDSRYHAKYYAVFEMLKMKKEDNSQKIRIEDLLILMQSGYDALVAAVLLYVREKGIDRELFYLPTWAHHSNSMVKEIAELMLGKEENTKPKVECLSYLHAVPIFSKLTSDALYNLSQDIQQQCFLPNENIVTQGEDGDFLYIITEGSCSVLIAKEEEVKEVAVVGKGEVIGEIAVINKIPRMATVKVLDRCSALVLSGDSFKQIIYKNPSVSIDILQEMTRRLLVQAN